MSLSKRLCDILIPWLNEGGLFWSHFLFVSCSWIFGTFVNRLTLSTCRLVMKLSLQTFSIFSSNFFSADPLHTHKNLHLGQKQWNQLLWWPWWNQQPHLNPQPPPHHLWALVLVHVDKFSFCEIFIWCRRAAQIYMWEHIVFQFSSESYISRCICCIY